jgi:hypothetical protein
MPLQNRGAALNLSMSAIEEIQKQVLALPLEQRILLAESLLGSLPPAGEDMTEAQEMVEVERREMEIESEKTLPLAEGEFWHKVQASADKRVTPAVWSQL